jgi:hypothetical protein
MNVMKKCSCVCLTIKHHVSSFVLICLVASYNYKIHQTRCSFSILYIRMVNLVFDVDTFLSTSLIICLVLACI